MKCPKCGGNGKEYWNGNVFCNTGFECDKCNGTGEIEMTNEEWFDTLPTIEEKAEAIYECVMANSWNFNKDGIKRWLKQPHKEK